MIRPGVTKYGNSWTFITAVLSKDMHEDRCQLLLFKKKEQEPSMVLDMKRRVGCLYGVTVSDIDSENYEYQYRINGEIVLDEYAQGVTGRKKFGENVVTDQLRCAFPDEDFIWEDDSFPEIPLNEAVIYSTHLRGYTMDRSAKVKNKGTFSGMKEKIPYLVELGINILELMPVYEFDEVTNNDRVDYWGYTKAFYFAPKATYGAGNNPARELKELVRELHKNKIELVLEFYFPDGIAPGYIIECLKFWVEEYHIDGFHINREGVPLKLLTLEPALKRTKIFTEYFQSQELSEEVRIPQRKHLLEYNDGFMIDARKLLKGDEDMTRTFSNRCRKNPDLTGVVNYITCHNGFTLQDLVSFDAKHNEENGENNQDGTSHNYSWNCGVEGPSKKKAIQEMRMIQQRNAFAMLMLSQGVPMIYGGDEFGNSQGGNNNVYGLDNATSWIQWSTIKRNILLKEYVKNLIAFRKKHSVFHQARELTQTDYQSTGVPDISYHGESAWYGEYEAYQRQIGIMYGGDYSSPKENNIYVAYNFHWVAHPFGLPNPPKGKNWYVIFDTRAEDAFCNDVKTPLADQRTMLVPGRCIRIIEGR